MERGDGSVDEASDAPAATDQERYLILNPTSGSADHLETVHRLAGEHDFWVRSTREAGHAIELARTAVAAGADVVVAAGGDGTFNEVVRGIDAAGALGDVTVGVAPVGTANIFAENVGVRSIEHAFEVIEAGRTRRIDLGMADGDPFVMSCIAGLVADASTATSGELKERFGNFAFVITGVRKAMPFEGLDIEVTAVGDGEETTWSGEVLCVLVGNSRRFVREGGQADMEDGLFEVALVEQMPPHDVVAEAVTHRLLGQDTEHVDHLRANRLELASQDGDPIDFSLDGEVTAHERLVLTVRPGALSVFVGEDYDPDPMG